MLGINAQTGQPLAGIDHLRQSIRDILTTRIGTRVMRRDYGSRLPALVDNPMTPRLAMDLYSATAEALARCQDDAQEWDAERERAESFHQLWQQQGFRWQNMAIVPFLLKVVPEMC